MAKYKAYPEYKDSGVEWLGVIPAGWYITKLKFTASLLTAKSSCGDDKFVGLENISSGDGKYINKEESISEGASITFKKNDVLFGKLRPYLAKSWLATFSGVCSSEFLVLRTEKIHPRFLNYYSLTTNFIEQVNSSTYGSKMPRASWEFISLLPVPTCSFILSEKIALFLDHETAKIDNLIEKQQQLIELLKEKRQAVISHAVTKGLNPDVPMKDSGVEWLGEVPEDWQLKQLRHLCSSKGGGTPSKNNPKFWIGDIPWVSPKDMKAQYIYDAEDHVSEEAVKLSSTKKIPIDSVLIVVRGMILAHSVPVSINKEIVTINQDMKALIPNENITSEYFYLVLTGFKRFLLELTDNSAHGTKCLRTDLLEKLWIPLPSIKQQEEIIRNVNELVAKLDSLVLRQEEAKKLLQERRTALISAAVTGKIDVRDWVAPDMQDAEEPQETTA